MRLEDLPSNYVDFTCGQETFRQLLWTFSVAGRLSIIFCHLISVAIRPSVNFLQHFLRQWYLASTSVNLGWSLDIICKLTSTFCVAGSPSINFHQPFVRPEELRRLPSNFRAAGRPYIQFRPSYFRPADLPLTSLIFHCIRETYRQFPSTFHAAGRLSVIYH